MLFLTVYRYQQTREEVWRNGKLIALASTADDDGTPHEIKGAAGADGMTVTSGKDTWTLPAESVPASFWNISMVTGKGLLMDSLSGRILDHRVATDVGRTADARRTWMARLPAGLACTLG